MSVTVSGAREGRTSVVRRLLARAAARDLAALVVPGPEVARALGLDLEAAGLRLAAGPRQASVLVVLGRVPTGLPEGLQRAAEVAYAQMPRPRATLIVGTGAPAALPADALCEPDQESLAAAVGGLRRVFREGAFAWRSEDFEAPALQTRTIYTCSMHPEVEQDEPGQCPRCGMDLIPKESSGSDAAERNDHGAHGHGGEHEDHTADAAGGGHGGHEEMDFMSMVEMTEGTPRSSDGLQMERVEAAFGPLLPGLPGGLSLSFTLDGDTVAGTEAASEARGTGGQLYGPAMGFAARLGGTDPLSPFAYRLLAALALEDAAAEIAPDGERLLRLAALETERAASHAGWISGFAYLLGLEPARREAALLEIRLRRLPGGPLRDGTLEPDHLSRDILDAAAGLSARLNRAPLLRRRLYGVGVLEADEAAGVGGPVARAAGLREDLRLGDADYESLGFEPVLDGERDAMARLRIRLAELRQSLRLARDALQLQRGAGPGGVSASGRVVDSGSGSASVETPRGPATLRLTVEGGEVVEAGLTAPSEAALALAGPVSEGRELGDALAGVASLDLSPWGLG